MPLSNAQRQERFRHKAKREGLERLDFKLPFETASKLRYLAQHWHCTKTEALCRMLLETWEREGRPVSGYDAEGKPLPSN